MASYQTLTLLYTLRARLQQPAGCHRTSYQTQPLLYTLRAQLQQPLGCHKTSYQTQPLLHSLRAQLRQPHGWHKLLTKLRSYCGLGFWLHLHPYRENFFLDGAFLSTSARTIHPYRKIFFLDGPFLSTSACTIHPYRKIFFLDGLFTRHFCLHHTSIQKNLLFGWTQCNNSQFSGHSIPLDTRHLIKRRAATNPPGFLITDIPRFPEPAPPREDTDPATAERLGLDRRQMRDTIAYFDGKGCLDLISLSSRRRGRHIAQMPPVRAGGRNNSSHIF